MATPIPWLCCPKAILPQLWKYACVHCPFGRPICNQALTSWLMSWDVVSIYPPNLLPHDAIYFVKYTSPSCSKVPPQHDAATLVLHGWDGVLRLASLPHFPPNITMVIMAKQFYFFQQTRGQKVRSLSPCANRSLAFLWRFWSSGFFLAERAFRLCQYRASFIVDIDTFVPVSSSIFTRFFCCCSGIDLHFSH